MKDSLKVLTFFSLGTLSLSHAVPSGLFVGGNISTNFNKFSSTTTVSDSGIASASIFNRKFNFEYGARAGFIFAMTNRQAIKLTGSYDVSKVFDTPFRQVGVSADYLLSFSRNPNSWGIFGGGGYQWGFYDFARFLDPFIKSGVGRKDLPFVQAGFFRTIGPSGRFMVQFGVKRYLGSYIKEDSIEKSDDSTRRNKVLLASPISAYLSLNLTF